jgi:hypothetical protein
VVGELALSEAGITEVGSNMFVDQMSQGIRSVANLKTIKQFAASPNSTALFNLVGPSRAHQAPALAPRSARLCLRPNRRRGSLDLGIGLVTPGVLVSLLTDARNPCPREDQSQARGPCHDRPPQRHHMRHRRQEGRHAAVP